MSCLYDSLSFFIGIDSYKLRQIICDYLEDNGKVMEDLDTNELLNIIDKDYIAKMRNSYTWGDAIIIKSACNIWNIRIIVYINPEHSKNIEFLPLYGIFTKTIYLEWQGTIHYVPVR